MQQSDVSRSSHTHGNGDWAGAPPPEAAATLAALFEGMASLLRAPAAG
jgi:hypothetical protein